MKPPPFVRPLSNGIWVMDNDKWITPRVEQCGKLNWDTESFTPVLEKIQNKRGCVIDVGAFIGDSVAWFRDRTCITFEPQRDAFVCLTHNLPGMIHYPFPAGNGELVNCQLAEGGNMGARRVKEGDAIRTIRIDDLEFHSVAFIKIDAEGWEPHVLLGATSTLRRCRPAVMVEINKAALDKTGFEMCDIEKYFDSRWQRIEVYRYSDTQWDTLYVPL